MSYSRTYPVKADISSADATKVGIFTNAGYWLPSSEGGPFEWPNTGMYPALAEKVARAINLAYEAGQENVREDFRELMGIEK